MSEALGVRQRVAARDALAVRMRALTGGALTASALLSGIFAGIAGATSPGHKLSGTTVHRTTAQKTTRTTASVGVSKAIPPLPPPPGPGGLSAAPPAPAAAPTATQAPPVVVSGGS